MVNIKFDRRDDRIKSLFGLLEKGNVGIFAKEIV
jgi:hypothetical protein